MKRIITLAVAAALMVAYSLRGRCPRTLNRPIRGWLGGGSFPGSGCTATTSTVATMCTGTTATFMGGTGSGSAPRSSYLGDDNVPREGKNRTS